MNKTTFAALPLSLLAGLFLSACGGGGSESTASSASSAAKFSSTDDVAILVGGFGGTFEEFLFLRQQGGSKPGRKMQWGAMSKSAASKPKATSTGPCSGGGTNTYTDETSTAYNFDGSRIYSNCKTSFSQQGYSFNSTLDGKIAERCTDNAQTTNVCNASVLRIADGANNSATLNEMFTSNDNGDLEDFELKVKGDITDATNGNTNNSQISGTMTFNDKIERLSGSAFFENLASTDISDSNTGGGSQTFNGVFGFSANSSRCAIGKVTVRTDSPLVYNSDFDTTAGQLTLTDGNGQSARA